MYTKFFLYISFAGFGIGTGNFYLLLVAILILLLSFLDKTNIELEQIIEQEKRKLKELEKRNEK